jgi:hypothetical protein
MALIKRITSRKIAAGMGKENENTRHADFMPIYSGISGSPRATLFTKEGKNARTLRFRKLHLPISFGELKNHMF